MIAFKNKHKNLVPADSSGNINADEMLEWLNADFKTYLIGGDTGVGKTTFLETGAAEVKKLTDQSNVAVPKTTDYNPKLIVREQNSFLGLFKISKEELWMDIDGKTFMERLDQKPEKAWFKLSRRFDHPINEAIRKAKAITIILSAHQIIDFERRYQSTDNKYFSKKLRDKYNFKWNTLRNKKNIHLVVSQSADVLALNEDLNREDLTSAIQAFCDSLTIRFNCAFLCDFNPEEASIYGLKVATLKDIKQQPPANNDWICSAGVAMHYILNPKFMRNQDHPFIIQL